MCKFSAFQDFQDFWIFLKFQFLIFQGWTAGEVSAAIPPGGNLVDGLPPASSCSWQLVGTEKNFDLFVILGAFFLEVMHSFITVRVIYIFAIKFKEKEN